MVLTKFVYYLTQGSRSILWIKEETKEWKKWEPIQGDSMTRLYSKIQNVIERNKGSIDTK